MIIRVIGFTILVVLGIIVFNLAAVFLMFVFGSM